MKHFLMAVVFWCSITVLHAQTTELVSLELAKAPKAMNNIQPGKLGPRVTLFVNDTLTFTGLTSNYSIEEWSTDLGKDLEFSHKELTDNAVKQDYRVARDTAILKNNDFWVEKGAGFTFKLHNWAIPEPGSAEMNLKCTIGYTILEPGQVLTEDITHLVGNFGFETLSLDFKGNTIDLKKVNYGRGEEAYTTFSGKVLNVKYEFAIENLQFLDFEGKVLDELYFGLNNQYGTNTKNRTDLINTAVIRIHYRKIKVKNISISRTFGLGL